MQVELKNKVALVCGSTQGIGKAVAIEFAKAGAKVILVSRNEGKMQKVLDQLDSSFGAEHGMISADFSDPSALQEALDNSGLAGEIHILLNNTGGPPGGPAISAELEEYRMAFNQHLICNQILASFCVEGMKAHAYGRIINVISTSVKQPLKGLGVSNTIRGAVANWSKTLATELGPYGITVNNVLPGATETERLSSIQENKSKKSGMSVEEVSNAMLGQIPAGRFGQPEELAYAVTFLASDKAAYINGTNVVVDGGRTSSL